MRNIILIGMPGCGKTTVGTRLAEALGRPFADADGELVRRIGEIPAFFAAHGEGAFRQAETEMLSSPAESRMRRALPRQRSTSSSAMRSSISF